MIGVDIGGTNILVGLIENGTVVERKHASITDKTPEAVVRLVTSVVESFSEELDAVGIAVAGSGLWNPSRRERDHGSGDQGCYHISWA